MELGPKESRVCGSVEFEASVPFVVDVEFDPEGKVEVDGKFDALDENAGDDPDPEGELDTDGELDPEDKVDPEDEVDPDGEVDVVVEFVEPEAEPLLVPLLAFPVPDGLPNPPKATIPISCRLVNTPFCFAAVNDVFNLAGRASADDRSGARFEAQTGDSPIASLPNFATTVGGMSVQDHSDGPRLLSIHVGKLRTDGNNETGTCVRHAAGMIGIVQVDSRRLEELGHRAEDMSLIRI